MAKTGKVLKAFPYAFDGITIETAQVGRVLAFPDTAFDGLEEDGFVEASGEAAENVIVEGQVHDEVFQQIMERLRGASDAELLSTIARSGEPYAGKLVHVDLVYAAAAQLRAEADGRKLARADAALSDNLLVPAPGDDPTLPIDPSIPLTANGGSADEREVVEEPGKLVQHAIDAAAAAANADDASGTTTATGPQPAASNDGGEIDAGASAATRASRKSKTA